MNYTFDTLSQVGSSFAGGGYQEGTLNQFVAEYVPLSREITMDEIRCSKLLSLKKFPDAVYFGECVKNDSGKLLRDGKGVMKYQNGRIYEGDWKTDQRNGRGFEKYSNDNTY